MVNKKSINKVILIGHVGNAPEVRYTKEGTLIASFSLATHELQNEEKEHTEWHNIIAWDKLADFASLSGSRIFLAEPLKFCILQLYFWLCVHVSSLLSY